MDNNKMTMDISHNESVVDDNKNSEYQQHKLFNKWNLYAHLPHDTDWSIKSYKLIATINTLEEIINLYQNLPDEMIVNCMLFLMRENIKPMWEDPKNINGGCFSYKISNNDAVTVWKKFSYSLVGETLCNLNNLNGITISPKKNFCIFKIWLNSCENQNPNTINYFKPITSDGCLFKKHITN